MIRGLLVALAVVGCGAFAPGTQLPASARRVAVRSTTSMETVLDMPGIQAPIGYFDPVNYKDKVSDEGMRWFRAAEIKHSRVAMLAFVGWCVNGAGIHFPGYLSKVEDVTFESLSKLGPIEAWHTMPESGKAQIVFTIFCMETVTEYTKPHYTKAGAEGYDPLDLIPNNKKYKTPADVRKAQNTELANGRLAMIGVMGFTCAEYFPGSVPAIQALGH